MCVWLSVLGLRISFDRSMLDVLQRNKRASTHDTIKSLIYVPFSACVCLNSDTAITLFFFVIFFLHSFFTCTFELLQQLLVALYYTLKRCSRRAGV